MLPDLETIQLRLRTLVPEQYQARETTVSFAPMRSAGLRFNDDGSVAWDRIWGSFCDLALAGGPPHRGTLLQPASAQQIAASPGACQQVMQEICRGITLVTALDAEPAESPAWVRVSCTSSTMAGWLLRAITVENISVRAEGSVLFLPAGPAYRIDKEIKNVITVIAKTTHYWRDHMPPSQQQAIADLFAAMDAESHLVVPELASHGTHSDAITRDLRQQTGLLPTPTALQYPGWLGIDCPSAHEALRLMRLLIASNILARREESTLFVPVHPTLDPGGKRILHTLARLA